MTQADKREMRYEIKRVLRGMSRDDRKVKSARVCRNIAQLSVFKGARTVMAYMPYATEVDISPLIGLAFRLKKTVCFPVVTGKGTMKAVEARETDEMVAGAYGILCPSDGFEVPPEDIDLVIAPGLAFDKDGNRLGKGGGYYDRFLPKTKAVIVCPAFCGQVVSYIPKSENDVLIDILATDEYIMEFND